MCLESEWSMELSSKVLYLPKDVISDMNYWTEVKTTMYCFIVQVHCEQSSCHAKAKFIDLLTELDGNWNPGLIVYSQTAILHENGPAYNIPANTQVTLTHECVTHYEFFCQCQEMKFEEKITKPTSYTYYAYPNYAKVTLMQSHVMPYRRWK